MADQFTHEQNTQQVKTEVQPPPPTQARPKRVPNNWGNRLAHIIFSFGLGYGSIEMYRQGVEGYWLLAGAACLTLVGALRDTQKNRA